MSISFEPVAEPATDPRPDPDPEYIRDISEFVFRSRLSRLQRFNIEHKGNMRARAAAWDSMTRIYLEAIKWRERL